MAVCLTVDCERKHHARGWCKLHWERWFRHGDPNYKKPPRHGPVCSVDGCENPQRQTGYCSTHYQRNRWHGDPTILLRRPNGTGCVLENGYIVIYMPDHPLATPSTRTVTKPRLVAYENLGPGEHLCHWCHAPVSWDRTWPYAQDGLTVDHLDWDRSNNDPSNLVPACGPCNSTRHQGVANG